MAIRWSTHAIVLGLILPTFASAQEATDSYMQYMLDRHVRAVEFKDFNQASAYLGTRDGVTESKVGTTTTATRGLTCPLSSKKTLTIFPAKPILNHLKN